MKSNGYTVEFLPLERRMLERRFIDAAPSLFDCERRFSERREIKHKDMADQFDVDLMTPPPLTH